jgi:hypothetical protein
LYTTSLSIFVQYFMTCFEIRAQRWRRLSSAACESVAAATPQCTHGSDAQRDAQHDTDAPLHPAAPWTAASQSSSGCACPASSSASSFAPSPP